MASRTTLPSILELDIIHACGADFDDINVIHEVERQLESLWQGAANMGMKINAINWVATGMEAPKRALIARHVAMLVGGNLEKVKCNFYFGREPAEGDAIFVTEEIPGTDVTVMAPEPVEEFYKRDECYHIVLGCAAPVGINAEYWPGVILDYIHVGNPPSGKLTACDRGNNGGGSNGMQGWMEVDHWIATLEKRSVNVDYIQTNLTRNCKISKAYIDKLPDFNKKVTLHICELFLVGPRPSPEKLQSALQLRIAKSNLEQVTTVFDFKPLKGDKLAEISATEHVNSCFPEGGGDASDLYKVTYQLLSIKNQMMKAGGFAACLDKMPGDTQLLPHFGPIGMRCLILKMVNPRGMAMRSAQGGPKLLELINSNTPFHELFCHRNGMVDMSGGGGKERESKKARKAAMTDSERMPPPAPVLKRTKTVRPGQKGLKALGLKSSETVRPGQKGLKAPGLKRSETFVA